MQKKKPLILSRKENIIRETLRDTEVIEVLALQVHDIWTTLYGRWKNVVVTELEKVECF